MIVNISPITTKLPFGKSQLFSYTVPKELEDQIQVGSIVEMPLGTRVVKGVVFLIVGANGVRPHLKQLKPISRIISDIQLNQYQLNLAMWIHSFYHAPLGIALKFMVPEIPKRYKIPSQMAGRQDTRYKKISNIKYQIIPEQNERFNKYIELIKKYRAINKQILILVPQIIDVETLYLRLDANLGKAAPLHSQLNITEYYNNWAEFQSGEIDVLVGTRQAVLSPPSNLGLVIIDGYQDDDFKQLDQTPRFSAVEAAKKVCAMAGAELILGGSAPEIGIAEACRDIFPPKNISIVDSQNEYYGKNFSPLSNKLQDLLAEAVQRNKWAMLLINRRGDSSFVICKDCGNVIKCPKCDVPLVLHCVHHNSEALKSEGRCFISAREKLICRRCSYKINPPAECPKCRSHKIKYSSPGTQGAEKEVIKLFGNQINIIRIDSDSLKSKKSGKDILDKLQKKSGIIIGTQIISKMWIPKEISLIGLLYVDSFLNRPDFKAPEKTFRIISELSGRLEKGGKMIIQTFNPENKTLSWAASGDFNSFCNNEIAARKQFNYPPFSRFIKLSLQARDTGKVLREVDRLKKLIKSDFKNIEIIGPNPIANPKKGLFGKNLILKIFNWSEKMHLELMEIIPDSWTVEN